MAVLSTRGLSGHIGKQLVFKATKGKTVVSAYGEPRKKKGTELQNQYRECFKRAQKRASQDRRKQEVIASCGSYLKPGQSLYHFLMGLYHREEIRMMKKGETRYESIEMLLSGETKNKKEVVNTQVHKVKEHMNAVWVYPVRKQEKAKTDNLSARPVMANRMFYGGWVSTYSG